MYQDVTATFESFYAGTSPRLLRYAYGLTGDMAEAQDLTQEAYARAWPRWTRLRGYDNPESWLRLVVSRLAVDRLRWLGVRRARAPREEPVVPPPDEEMLTLVAALKRLPMAQRKALVLHYFLDMPVAEIAEETGTNVNTVKTWLSRGRVNVAAQLAEVAPNNDLQEVRGKARRRRNRTIATTITAFLATATAAAAIFLAIPAATPPVVDPDLILPYPGQPYLTFTFVVDQRAIALWWGTDGEGSVGVVDLATGRHPWPPVGVGKFDDSLFPLGIRGGVLAILGDDDTTGTGLLGVDLSSGRIAWRLPRQRQRQPLFDLQPDPSAAQAERGILVVHDELEVSGIDWRTGRQVWKFASTPDTGYSFLHRDQFAQVEPSGVLRIRDVNTGRVISERSGAPNVENANLTLLSDWLYVAGDGGVLRLPVTGSQPASQLVGGGGLYAVSCGKHVCIDSEQFVVAFDRQTGQQVWRRETGSRNMAVGDFGTILTIAGTGPKDALGAAPDDRQIFLDPDGKDITPPSLGTRKAYWVDSEHLIFSREVERVVPSPPVPMPPGTFELSLYSMVTHEERPLGQHYLYGNCAGVPGKLVCPGKEGFILIR